MDKQWNLYLEQVEKHLKPLPVSERVDIVQEIKSQIQELQQAGKTEQEILERLGDPRALARAYLGDLIAETSFFSWGRVLALCAYYSLAGLSGLFVIPVLGICAPVFFLCGAVIPFAGGVKLVNELLHLHLPYVQYIGVAGVDSPVQAFLICVAVGVALCLLGYGCWRLLVGYVRSVSRVGRVLSR